MLTSRNRSSQCRLKKGSPSTSHRGSRFLGLGRSLVGLGGGRLRRLLELVGRRAGRRRGVRRQHPFDWLRSPLQLLRFRQAEEVFDKAVRDAAERGDLKAQVAVGKLYLMGLEEMGSDPAEAEKWLSIAAGRGHKEAKKLLAQASTAKKNEVAYRRWVDTQRVYLREYWQSRYTYRWYWNNSGWYYRDDY